MNPVRSVAVHAALFALGGLAASLAWSKDKTPRSAQEGTAQVWSGRPTDVQRIVYEGKGRKLDLVSQVAKSGPRWFLATVGRDAPPAGDGGAPAEAPKTAVFASVTAANKIADALAPLKATRALGKLEPARLSEFGLDKSEVAVTVTLSGKEHKLVVGSPAPGGTDMYVLDPSTNEAYALKGDFLGDLDLGDARLMERDQHAFKESETTKAVVLAGGKTRELVRGGSDTKKFWADPAERDKADETAGNWLQKVDRLRVSEYAASAPEGRTLLVRIEYSGNSGSLGFVELAKTPANGGEGQKPDFWIVTEHTHLWGKVAQAAGEQIEQDVASIVK